MKAESTELISYQVSWLAALFAPDSDYASLSLTKDRILFSSCGKTKAKTLSYIDINPGIVTEKGYFWDVLVIQLKNGETLRFGGVAKSQLGRIERSLKHYSQEYIRDYYQCNTHDLLEAFRQAQVLFSGQRYIRHTVTQQWFNNHRHLDIWINPWEIKDFLLPEALQYLQVIRPLLTQGYDYIGKLNESYVQKQLASFQLFFDQVESNPLTENQRKACVIDEQHNLVLAGAGTGKTSTMIGRAGYLIKAGIAQPEKILMLAYARKAAEEMDERIQSKIGVNNLTVKTFHSLGKQIIAQIEGVMPTTSVRLKS